MSFTKLKALSIFATRSEGWAHTDYDIMTLLEIGKTTLTLSHPKTSYLSIPQVSDQQPVGGVHVRVLLLRVAHLPGPEGGHGRRGRLLALRIHQPPRIRIHPRPRPGDQKQVSSSKLHCLRISLQEVA